MISFSYGNPCCPESVARQSQRTAHLQPAEAAGRPDGLRVVDLEVGVRGSKISVWIYSFSRYSNCRERFIAWVSTIRRGESTTEESVELLLRLK